MDKATSEEMVEAFESAMLKYCYCQFKSEMTMENLTLAYIEKEKNKELLIKALTAQVNTRLLEAAKAVILWHTADSRAISPVFTALSDAISNTQVTTDNGEKVKE
jgi:hypothetical protein